MIIQDEWDKMERGFKFTYTRHSENLPETRRFFFSGIAKPVEQYKSQQTFRENCPSLHKIKTFFIYAKEGNFEVFKLPSGKLLESGEAKDFRNAEIQITIAGSNSAVIFGNIASDAVKLVKDEKSLTFIETTAVGNKQVLIIKDRWDAKEKGFEFTYIRNTEALLFGELIRSIYIGVAKPAM